MEDYTNKKLRKIAIISIIFVLFVIILAIIFGIFKTQKPEEDGTGGFYSQNEEPIVIFENGYQLNETIGVLNTNIVFNQIKNTLSEKEKSVVATIVGETLKTIDENLYYIQIKTDQDQSFELYIEASDSIGATTAIRELNTKDFTFYSSSDISPKQWILNLTNNQTPKINIIEDKY